MKEKKNIKIYPQKFRKKWLEDHICKDWIQEDYVNERNAFCKFCRTTIQAKYTNIKQHVKTKKHLKSIQCIEFGEELELPTKHENTLGYQKVR